MTLEEITLEQLKTGETSIERALLVVSGLQTEEEVAAYQVKLDFIQDDFEQEFSGGNDYETAEALFDYFWKTKPNRFNEENDFFLTDVINNQLDEDKNKPVGNCLGLTSLYSVLGQRLGLDLAVLRNHFHLLNVLYDREEVVIENQWSFGFNYDSHISGFKKEDLNVLVSDVLNSRGKKKQKSDDLKGALVDYNLALEQNQYNVNAFCNRGRINTIEKNYHNALLDYDRAIELKPNFAEALEDRAIIREWLGNRQGALADYERIYELTKK